MVDESHKDIKEILKEIDGAILLTEQKLKVMKTMRKAIQDSLDLILKEEKR